MLLLVLTVTVLFASICVRIASSPPFPLLFALFGNWADRCRHGAEVEGWPVR